jgi:hypothetical protein
MKIPVPRIISTVDIANGDDSEIQDAKRKGENEHETETDRQTDRQISRNYTSTYLCFRTRS